MRIIDADSLVRNIKKWEKYIGKYEKYIPYDEDIYVSTMLTIEDEPTVDAVPVRHGKWIIRDNPGTGWYIVTCSECGEDVTSLIPMIGFFPNAKAMWDYCPNCGARMDSDD